ncbi:Furin-like protease 1, isoform 1-CRR [Stylophora pistillata]|uniref:Furin-like protease 1, isoform 1-CRR n=1 Tax=Stylophora pistillata TaxID=50429 RepID=A0A2B4RLC3_STYPI|nr:Furin-like protease 1, isoform 1-CRR [Stylophora pistillata]
MATSPSLFSYQMAFLKLFFLLALSYTCISKRELRYTNTWAVKIDGDINSVKDIAEMNGFNYKMKVKWFAQQIRQERALYDQAMSLSFNDPRWRDQMWYLNPPGGRGMNINEAWQQGVTGKGIVVAVVDDGLQQSHPDLEDNYDPSASFDLVDFDEIPDPIGNFSGHGNRCAGVIAASANNTECGVGVAFNARLGGIRIFGEEDDDSTDSMEALAFEYKRDYMDIYSCSWGPEDTGWDMEGPGELARGQLEEGTKTGRLGKGSIFVFAAGNGGRQYDSCAYNGYANSVFTITVSGVNKNGSIPGYAERCSAVMAATYSQDNERGVDSIITSDLDSTCSSTFEATSAATALASGIIALAMEVKDKLQEACVLQHPSNWHLWLNSVHRFDFDFNCNQRGQAFGAAIGAEIQTGCHTEARASGGPTLEKERTLEQAFNTTHINPEVTWRDVQHLIAYSSNHDVPRSGDWMQNAAGLWVSSYFGFGLMDAAALVNYSRSWHTVPEQIKCEIPQPRVNRFIGQYGDTEVTLNVSKFNCNGENTIQYLEHVVVIIQARLDEDRSSFDKQRRSSRFELLEEYRMDDPFVPLPLEDAPEFPEVAEHQEQRLPSMWKLADVSPIPKRKLVKDVKKDLRPISLTPCLCNLAEDLVVTNYVKPAALRILDDRQYGAVPKSSTTLVLLEMFRCWTNAADGNCSSVRTILFDYRKALDLIDHKILIAKWILDLNAEHTVKLEEILEELLKRDMLLGLTEELKRKLNLNLESALRRIKELENVTIEYEIGSQVEKKRELENEFLRLLLRWQELKSDEKRDQLRSELESYLKLRDLEKEKEPERKLENELKKKNLGSEMNHLETKLRGELEMILVQEHVLEHELAGNLELKGELKTNGAKDIDPTESKLVQELKLPVEGVLELQNQLAYIEELKRMLERHQGRELDQGEMMVKQVCRWERHLQEERVGTVRLLRKLVMENSVAGIEELGDVIMEQELKFPETRLDREFYELRFQLCNEVASEVWEWMMTAKDELTKIALDRKRELENELETLIKRKRKRMHEMKMELNQDGYREVKSAQCWTEWLENKLKLKGRENLMLKENRWLRLNLFTRKLRNQLEQQLEQELYAVRQTSYTLPRRYSAKMLRSRVREP